MKTTKTNKKMRRRRAGPVRRWWVRLVADYGRLGISSVRGVVDARSGVQAIELMQQRCEIEPCPGMILQAFAILKPEGGAA